ncbi:MAG TPA: hypothetical protein VKB48_09590 [Candidatus Acidoferrum sp.]|nr:hypothetical protein [Candidatus Acidoferrum sp.]
MKNFLEFAGAGLVLLFTMGASRAAAQVPVPAPVPVLVPAAVDTAVPIIVNAVKPKPKVTGLATFEGYVMNVNTLQITLRAKGNDLTIETFPLSEAASARMQQIVDKGGYHYGDKVRVEYDPQSMKVVRFKGKPSKAL